MVSASPVVWSTQVAGTHPMPSSRSPPGWLPWGARKISSITSLQQTSTVPGVTTATLEGRTGRFWATITDVPARTLMLRSRFAGSRSGISKVLWLASSQVRKNGATRPVTTS
jgi:hypothetical protein